MDQPPPSFLRPTPIERLINQFFGSLVGLGFGFQHNYLLEVKGRKTGKLHSTPVNVLQHEKKLFLVAGRGYSQWVRNAMVDRQVTLKKGRVRLEFELRAVPDEEKPEILKAYLRRFPLTVQRYFPVAGDASREAFVPLAGRYPVFELIRKL